MWEATDITVLHHSHFVYSLPFLLSPSSLLSLSFSLSTKIPMATLPVVNFPIFTVVRVVGVAVTVLLLTWALHFRGGLALVSDNKDLIFNVSFPLHCLLFSISGDGYTWFAQQFRFSVMGNLILNEKLKGRVVFSV